MADNTGMAEHHASVTVDAPLHQVYSLFTHFNDFPKFMSFVKEVTYYDDQRSHWVAEVVGRHEWDAVNENWVEDQQVGWRSTDGLENFGKVTFQAMGANQTRVDVYINYNPPAGVLGDVGENLGAGSRFDSVLQHDLDNFARMVHQAPPGALDPTSSNFLFHGDSAAAQGTTTERQNQTMSDQGDYPHGSYQQTTQSSYQQGTQSDYQQGTYPQRGYQQGTQSDYQQGTQGDYQQGGYQQGNYPQSGYQQGTQSGYQQGTQSDYQQGNYPQSGSQQGGYQQGTQSDYQQGNYPSSAGTTYSTGAGRDYMQDPGNTPGTTSDTGYTSGTSTGYTSGTSDADYTTNRPVTDQDIISGNTPRDREKMTPMPPSSGATNPVIPPDTGTSNPVMPPERDRTDY